MNLIIDISQSSQIPSGLSVSSTPGWGYDHFDVIQDGIDAVAENGTVYVYNGTYYENVVVDKTINLTGEDRNTTIIDGGGSGNVVYISANCSHKYGKER